MHCFQIPGTKYIHTHSQVCLHVQSIKYVLTDVVWAIMKSVRSVHLDTYISLSTCQDSCLVGWSKFSIRLSASCLVKWV